MNPYDPSPRKIYYFLITFCLTRTWKIRSLSPQPNNPHKYKGNGSVITPPFHFPSFLSRSLSVFLSRLCPEKQIVYGKARKVEINVSFHHIHTASPVSTAITVGRYIQGSPLRPNITIKKLTGKREGVENWWCTLKSKGVNWRVGSDFHWGKGLRSLQVSWCKQ